VVAFFCICLLGYGIAGSIIGTEDYHLENQTNSGARKNPTIIAWYA